MNNTGGPAFPNEGFNGWGEPQQGMSLRDFFAAKAMQGMLAYAHLKPLSGEDMYACDAYTMADAMLAAREQK